MCASAVIGEGAIGLALRRLVDKGMKVILVGVVSVVAGLRERRSTSSSHWQNI